MVDRRNLDNSRNMNINDDYLELLSKADEYEDIYSGASDDYEDISSSSGDIYIGSGRRTSASQSDVYFNKPQKSSYDDESFEETRIYGSSNRSYQAEVPRVNNTPSRPVQPVTRATQGYAPQGYGQPAYTQPAPQVQSVSRRAQKFDTNELSDEISDHDARKKKRKRGPKIFLAIVAVFLAVTIGLVSYVTSVVNGIVDNFNEAEEIEHIDDVESLTKEDHVRNILLIGTDAERGGSARSDSIMIISVNKETGRITACSILRDTHVDIPGECEAKINSAYSWGGVNLLIQTIEQNFGIYIDDYASVDFEMFTALVDALGGIDVEVTEAEATYINEQHVYGNEERPEEVPYGDSVHLDGYQALWYVRIRKLDSDWQRTERQRKVIGAIMEGIKAKVEAGEIGELIDMANDIAPYITTTLDSSDLWNLLFSLVSCYSKSEGDMDKLFVPQQLPFEDTWEYTSEWDGSSISLDVEENKILLYELLYEEYEIEAPEEE